MKRIISLSFALLAIYAATAPAATVPAQAKTTTIKSMPHQTTTGPTPPPGIEPKVRETREMIQATTSLTVVLPVPGYFWRHGCAPTAVGMIVGYYDGHGYDDLISGDAFTQIDAVNQAIASKGTNLNPRHYEDYCLPKDDNFFGPIRPDKSEPPEGDEHPHDCIADFMRTSWSSIGNRYGYSFGGDVGPAFVSYVNSKNPYYIGSYSEYPMWDGTLNWEILTEEIDNDRPMIFSVDTATLGHAVTVVGYRQTPTRQYGCLDTWEPADVIRWCDFEPATGQPWGIWSATSLHLAPIRDMLVKQETTFIPDEIGTYDFGRIDLGFTKAITFTIENIGETDINLTGSPIVGISGDNADAFIVTQQPPEVIPAGGLVAFEITFNAHIQSHCSAAASIDNDEIDKGVYNFSITGTGGLTPLTIYVDDDAHGDPGSGTKQDPFKRIGDAVDAAYDGDEIVIADGTYTGPDNLDIDLNGKAIVIRSRDPNNPGIVAATIIDCNATATDHHRAFVLDSGEDSNTVITGITITNGYASNGAGIYCKDSSPVITNCNFTDGSASNWGGGIYCDRSSAVITNCTFTGNSASEGAAITIISYGSPIIDNCVITGNTASISGGGINSDLRAEPTISNCIITGNFAGSYGGGGISIYGSDPSIINCLITGNSTDNSGGGILHMYESAKGSTITNCTIANNTAANHGGGVHGASKCKMTITNSILWDNTGEMVDGGHMPGSSPTIIFSYCDIQSSGGSENWKWQSIYDGAGNIDQAPLFVDYNLSFASPCVDTGTNEPVSGLPATDIDGNPRLFDGDNDGIAVVDMGAYEWKPDGPIIAVEPTNVTVVYQLDSPGIITRLLSIWNAGDEIIDWQITEDCPWLEVAPAYGQSSGEVNEVVLTIDANGLNPGDYSCVLTVFDTNIPDRTLHVCVNLFVGTNFLLIPSQYPTIQEAIDAATDGDIVLVADGIYTGTGNRDIDFRGKAITLTSENGPENCIIDCQGTRDERHRGFYFHNGEQQNSILNGLTITSGYVFDDGGGIKCYQSNPTITGCTISGNQTQMDSGAIYCYQSSPTIAGCIISGNQVEMNGGAIYCNQSNPTIAGCTIRNNMCGGIYSRGGSPIINNCIISGNNARDGGGIIGDESIMTISDCDINNNINISGRGGAGGISVSDGIYFIHNCIISGNKNEDGGAIKCRDNISTTISSCIISGNSADRGGGVFCDDSSLTISNCTISGNSAYRGGGIYNYVASPILTNCILWDNAAPNGNEIALHRNSTIDATYSNIKGGWQGKGNIDSDPCFLYPGYWDLNGTPGDANDDFWIDGDYHLLGDSLCINTGDPNYITIPNETDLDGNQRILGGCIDMGAYEFNHIPVADAGPNTIAYAEPNGIALVTLDGTGSYDDDGDELTYLWAWTIDGNDYDANSPAPTIQLPVGEHIIELIVNDGIEDSEPDEVTITVVEPLQVRLWLFPRTINRHSRMKRVMAWIHLPKDITKDQIDEDQPVLLYCPDAAEPIEPIRQYVFQHGRGSHKRTYVLAYYDKAELMTAVPGNGPVDLEVIGRLKTSQYFYGSDTVRIIGRRWRRWWRR